MLLGLFLQFLSLGPLVKKVKEFQIEAVVSALCANMASENEQLRDISSIGLKTVINELPLTSNSLVEAVCKNITQRISSVILKVGYVAWCEAC